ILGHDLMNPHILLRNTARTISIPNSIPDPKSFDPWSKNASTHANPEQGKSDFLAYCDALLSRALGSNGGLLSPTFPPAVAANGQNSFLLRRQSSIGLEEPKTTKEAIDLAILRSNVAKAFSRSSSSSSSADGGGERNSPNRFVIARSGRRVATLCLQRPFWRLGETVFGVVNVNQRADDIRTYALTITLESSENVDPSLALRSRTGVERATRRVHWVQRENTVGGRRVGLGLGVPANGTPEFGTTGVGVQWRVRVAFVTERVVVARARAGAPHRAVPRGRKAAEGEDGIEEGEGKGSVAEEEDEEEGEEEDEDDDEEEGYGRPRQ
ncbi:hypothetical protein LTS18_002520, partial [Coniosporium uncinatum]